MTPCSLLAYVGPDTFLPLTSALSAVAGVVMFLWGTGIRSITRGFSARFRRSDPPHRPAPNLDLRRRPRAANPTMETHTHPPAPGE
jgi:hypothetical protein